MDNLFQDIEAAFSGFDFESALEVAIISVVVYWLLRLLRGTTAMTVVRGISILVVVIVLLSRAINSVVLDWLINNALAVLVLFVLIVFQPEFRRALERVGRAGGVRSWFGVGHETYHELIEVISVATEHLAERRRGALMVLERDTGLQDVVETGILVDAVPTPELIEGIFFPNSPLHDGAVVIRPGRVVAASCILPTSSDRGTRHAHLGTRHLAALGMTEQTDAIVVVVSEQTGHVAVATDGRLVQRLDRRRLESLLESLLSGNGHGLGHSRAPAESA